MKKVIDRGNRSKALSEVKPVENINKNPQSFLEISPVHKEFLLSCKLQNHAYKPVNFPESVSLTTIIEMEIDLTN